MFCMVCHVKKLFELHRHYLLITHLVTHFMQVTHKNVNGLLTLCYQLDQMHSNGKGCQLTMKKRN